MPHCVPVELFINHDSTNSYNCLIHSIHKNKTVGLSLVDGSSNWSHIVRNLLEALKKDTKSTTTHANDKHAIKQKD